MGRRLVLRSSSAEETRSIASTLARSLLPGDVVALTGDLGAGKTCFVQGSARALGVGEQVTSPSFVLVREYQGVHPLLHLDVYRLNNLQELVDLGYEELLDPSRIVFIEWGDVVGPLLPEAYLEVVIRGGADEPRGIDLHAHGGDWDTRLARMSDAFERFRAPAGR
jgi:tRNA threonylcarbamoyladenosine biosynthesis protein TsaE